METLQPNREHHSGPEHQDKANLPPVDPWADNAHASEHYQIPQEHDETLTYRPSAKWSNLKEPQDPWAGADKNASSETARASNVVSPENTPLPPLASMSPQEEAAKLREIEDKFNENTTPGDTQDKKEEYTPRHLRLNEEPFVSNPASEAERRNETNFKATVNLATSLQKSNPELMDGVNKYLDNTPLPTTKPPAADPNAFTKGEATALRDQLAAEESTPQAPQPEQTAQPESYKGRHRRLGRVASWFARFRG